jgi:hypothetical protein
MVTGAGSYVDAWHPEPGDAESMFGIPAKKSRDRLDNGLLIDVPGIPGERDKKEDYSPDWQLG